MRKFYDTEHEEIITEATLRAEFEQMKKDDPANYDYTFEQFITVCNGKNGTLKTIRMTLCPHCYEAIRSRGEKLHGIHFYTDDIDEEADEITEEADRASYCEWCEEAGHGEIYIII